MDFASELPQPVTDLLLSALNAEFATLTGSGVPIDTPMMIFPSDGLRSIDVCTGLAYPAKAERARGNPKVGMLVEGGVDDPVVSIAGMASVHDADIQSNTNRYIRETAYARPLNPPWSQAREAVYYWARMLVAVTPRRILWWDRPDQMDSQPHRWEAPADVVYPPSDARPAGSVSSAPKWPQPSWQELARSAMGLDVPAHLTLCDGEGFPLPIRARSVEVIDDGFALQIPTGAPWARAGSASLTFVGRETFVGTVHGESARVRLKVERGLPINPFMTDPAELWNPRGEVRQAMMGRLESELQRRGQSIPILPDEEPELTENAKRRQAALSKYFTGATTAE